MSSVVPLTALMCAVLQAPSRSQLSSARCTSSSAGDSECVASLLLATTPSARRHSLTVTVPSSVSSSVLRATGESSEQPRRQCMLQAPLDNVGWGFENRRRSMGANRTRRASLNLGSTVVELEELYKVSSVTPSMSESELFYTVLCTIATAQVLGG